MDVNDLFQENACNISGHNNTSDKWSWEEYFTNKKSLENQGKQVVLVDMVNDIIEWAIHISNDLFFSGHYPEGTTFCLYCHSGGSSGYVAKQLQPQLPQYRFINITGWLCTYKLYKL